MTFFEELLVLLLTAVVLLQLARHLRLPYPAMLAGAGVLVAFLPGAPVIRFEPATALALFIAPVILDAAFDFPAAAALRFVVPLLAFAGFAVLLTALLVMEMGHHLLGLPYAAALALGAIVAPPDAAAATAVLSSVSVPRTAEEVLRGESLFNDATALLLFSGAVTFQTHGTLHLGGGLLLLGAVPGGVLLGIAAALVMRRLNSLVRDSLGGNPLQFVLAYLIWIVAEHLHLSAVLCTIAFAMTLARSPEVQGNPRMRVQSYAVWSAVVFTLNVLAFLIMGMQSRTILHHLSNPSIEGDLRFAGLTVIAVIVARLVVVVGFNRLNAWRARRKGDVAPPPLRQAFFVGWAGMRGFVTLATAFALPADFPQRDTVVLTAFAVVLGTLVLQGLTLGPLIRLLHLDKAAASGQQELSNARKNLAKAGLRALDDGSGEAVENLRFVYRLDCNTARADEEPEEFVERHDFGLRAIAAERDELESLRNSNKVGINAYLQLQEEIDWRELALLRDDERRIEEV